MANNYYQATLTPDSIHLNPMHLAYLGMTGATCELESDGRYYVFWRECLNDCIDDYEVNQALADGAIDQEQADFILKSNFEDMLRHILYYNPEVDHLRVDGAFTCGKMRPGEFGGAACIVSRTQYLHWNNSCAFYNSDTGKIEMRWCEVEEFDSPSESQNKNPDEG